MADNIRPNAVIVDPPRVGLDSKLIDTFLRNPPEKFVYISCNPSTLAKDLTRLVSKYRVEYLQPVDMFPQTPHVETVVKMTRR
jgi:SAM-dependent methyltransferases related to tRNA (uracil-5-)-methyltransferase